MLSFELRVSTAAPLLTKIFTFISQVNYDKFNLFSKVDFGHQYAVTFIDRVKLIIAFERAGKRLSFELRMSTVAPLLTKILYFISHVNYDTWNLGKKVTYGRPLLRRNYYI